MKPNVWKKISSVIIILIMMVRNIHAITDSCKNNIEGKTFQLMNRHVWLTVNQTGKPHPEFGQEWKYILCSLQPKGGMEYYLFDLRSKRFVCPGMRKKGHIFPGRAVALREPLSRCRLTERIKGGYTRLYGNNNTTEIISYKQGKRKNNLAMLEGILKHYERYEYCKEGLEKYCASISRRNVREKKHLRAFKDKFCDTSCWK